MAGNIQQKYYCCKFSESVPEALNVIDRLSPVCNTRLGRIGNTLNKGTYFGLFGTGYLFTFKTFARIHL